MDYPTLTRTAGLIEEPRQWTGVPASHPPSAREEARVCFSPQADVGGGLLICAIGVDAVCHIGRRREFIALAWIPALLGARPGPGGRRSAGGKLPGPSRPWPARPRIPDPRDQHADSSCSAFAEVNAG